MSVWLALQVGSGVFLDPATSDEVEIDATGMSPCILAPPQCISGATYMFWVKLHDTISGVVFTTLDWDSPREGIGFHLNDSSFWRHFADDHETSLSSFVFILFGHFVGYLVNS